MMPAGVYTPPNSPWNPGEFDHFKDVAVDPCLPAMPSAGKPVGREDIKRVEQMASG